MVRNKINQWMKKKKTKMRDCQIFEIQKMHWSKTNFTKVPNLATT